MDDLDVPEGKRVTDAVEVDEDLMGEAYELPPDEGELEEGEVAEGSGLSESAQEEDYGRWGRRFWVLLHVVVLAFLGVVVYTVVAKKKANDQAAKVQQAQAFAHKYVTKKGSTERAIEDALLPIDLGESALHSIAWVAGKTDHCEIVIDLPKVYWGGNEEMKADAASKAAVILKTTFAACQGVQRIAFRALGVFIEEGGDKRSDALMVDAMRTEHAKADYSGKPEDVLKGFRQARYHKALQ